MTFDPDQKQAIYDHLCEMPTVDAHEHLHPEPMRCERKVDIFLLFHQYLRVDLICAGMDEQAAADLDDENVPLDRKWASLAPYLDLVRSGSVAQPPFIALRKFFDADDLTEDNYAELSARMREHNRPGLYEKCLREACNIVLVLNQNRTMWQTDLFKPILHGPRFIGSGSRQSLIEGCAEDDCEPPADLASYLAQMEGRVRRHKANGMLGVKGHLHPYVPGDKDAARRAYPRLMADRARADDGRIVEAYLKDRLYELCGELDLVVVQHSGIWAGQWADIVPIRPTNIFALANAHRSTRFDLFHAASPQPADAGFVGRSLPNVYLNACWSHLLSPHLTKLAYHMWLDMMPINRVMAWGGDYWWAVENVYGVVTKVRDILAEVLAERIAAGDFGEARALQIAKRWMHDNPREVYFLD